MKNIRKIVATALVTFQVILTAAVGFIPASAEAGTQGNAYSYQVYKADAPIKVDGAVTEGEAWDNLPWSENFSWRWCQNNWHLKSDYIASFKSMWYKNADGEAFLYFLFNINDEDGYTNGDKYDFGIDETGMATGNPATAADATMRRSGGTSLAEGTLSKNTGKGDYYMKHAVTRVDAEHRVTLEIEYKFYAPENAADGKTVGFEINIEWLTNGQSNAIWSGNRATSWGSWNEAKNYGALKLHDAAATTRRAANIYNGNEVVVSADITENGKFTLPTTFAASSNQLVGWKDAEGKLYKPGKELTGLTANATFTAVTADFKTLDGAAVRFADPTGLRFYSQASKADFDALGAALTATGTLILPTDMLGAGALTLEALAGKEESKDYLNIVNSGWLNAATAEADGYYQFSGAIVNIKAANYDRNFSAVGYFTVTYENGETANFYGGYKAANATSVKTVATKALEDLAANPDKYNATEKAILESYTK